VNKKREGVHAFFLFVSRVLCGRFRDEDAPGTWKRGDSKDRDWLAMPGGWLTGASDDSGPFAFGLFSSPTTSSKGSHVGGSEDEVADGWMRDLFRTQRVGSGGKFAPGDDKISLSPVAEVGPSSLAELDSRTLGSGALSSSATTPAAACVDLSPASGEALSIAEVAALVASYSGTGGEGFRGESWTRDQSQEGSLADFSEGEGGGSEGDADGRGERVGAPHTAAPVRSSSLRQFQSQSAAPTGVHDRAFTGRPTSGSRASSSGGVGGSSSSGSSSGVRLSERLHFQRISFNKSASRERPAPSVDLNGSSINGSTSAAPAALARGAKSLDSSLDPARPPSHFPPHMMPSIDLPPSVHHMLAARDHVLDGSSQERGAKGRPRRNSLTAAYNGRAPPPPPPPPGPVSPRHARRASFAPTPTPHSL
jgi:hypothetical protein